MKKFIVVRYLSGVNTSLIEAGFETRGQAETFAELLKISKGGEYHVFGACE